MATASAKALTDHDRIRAWAESRNATPACVKGTGRKGSDTGLIRLDFPGYSGADSLQPITWRSWFKAFDDNGLALIVQDTTSRGQRSNFNKLVSRDSVSTGRGARGRTARTSTTSRKTSGARKASAARKTKSASARRPAAR